MEKHSLFNGVEEKLLEDIKKSAVSKKFSKNELIYFQEDEAKYIFFIKKGWVKLFTETIEGEEAIIDILPEYHIFGDQAILEGSLSSHSAEAVENCEVVLVPINKIRELFSKSTKFAMNMLEILTSKQKFRDREVEHLSLQSAPQRIGCFLLRLCKADDQTNIKLNLPYDKSLIASRLGMKAETFSRALNKLKNEVGISVSGGSISIPSIASLSGYCCGACSNSFPCKDVKANSI